MIFRIQDAEGRGPWRPGFSRRWLDEKRTSFPRAVQEAFPDFRTAMKPEMHYGCGFRSLEQMRAWISKNEMWALRRLGFSLVTIEPDEVIAENEEQVIFGCRVPLAQCATIFSHKEAR